MSRITCIFLVILGAAALAASSASAARSSGRDALIVFTQGNPAKDDSVAYTFEVGSTLDSASPYGGTLAISPCHEGQPEIKMAHRTRHLSSGESLAPDKAGNLVWHMPMIPPSGRLNRLRITFSLPQGKGGPTYCVRVTAQAYGGLLPGPISYEASVSLEK